VGATLIYAPVKTAYPESKDLGRFHRPEALLNVQSDFSNSRHASKAYASLSTLVDIRSEESPRRQNSMSIRERKSKFTMKVGEHLGVSWFTSHVRNQTASRRCLATSVRNGRRRPRARGRVGSHEIRSNVGC